MNTPVKPPRSPWPIAIVLFFIALVAFHAVVIYLAVTHPDPVDQSYQTHDR